MLLLHLFKLPHDDTEQNQMPTLLWLHDNIITSILAYGWSRSLLVLLNFVFGLHIDYQLVCNMNELKVKKIIIGLFGKEIIRKNGMTKRHRDLHLFLLGSVPTQNNIHIVTSKLPTNKQELPAFIAKTEDFDQTKNKKPFYHDHLHLLVQMIVMKVNRQNYWQALQLLLLHFFLISSACSSLTRASFLCLISDLCVLISFPAVDAVRLFCIDERTALSSVLDNLLHTSFSQQAMFCENVS